jgi:hypothetical protein
VRRSTRQILAVVAIAFGAFAVLYAGGTRIGPCLGPLGVTVVQCARASGVFPDVGIGVPIAVLAVAVAALLLAAPARSRWLWSSMAALVGAGAAAIGFVIVAPRTMEGFISSGEFISIPRPVDQNALASLAFAGALIAFLVAVRAMRDPVASRHPTP